MSVSISIEDAEDTPRLVFEDDDPIYWFLFPYFKEVWSEVGQMIHPSGNAEFFAEELLAFFLILESAEADAQFRDQEWKVAMRLHGKDWIESLVKKSDIIACIDSLKEMLNCAYNTDRKVVCNGD